MRKQYGFFRATLRKTGRTFGRSLCGLALGVTLCTEEVAAMVYYVSPTGNDSAAGTDDSPWETFDYAMYRTACGDRLILKDGEYTTASHGTLIIKKSCTASTPFRVQAQNQRKAHLKGDGTAEVLSILSSAHVTVDGLLVTSADNRAANANYVNVRIGESNNITLRNLIVSHNNRYWNTTLIALRNATYNLIEDSEMYYWHRHGLTFGRGANHNVARRIYANSRGYADIKDGFPSGFQGKGDAAFANYPGGNNIVENCISEGQGSAFDIEASQDGSVNNQFLGDISLNDQIGFLFRARGSTSTNQPQNTIIENGLVINSTTAGAYFRGNLNTQCNNCTFYNGASYGILADFEAVLPGGGTYSVFGTNVLTMLNYRGAYISKQTNWTFTYINAYGNKIDFDPSSTIQNYQKPTVIDPLLGTCRAWIPDDSPMKEAGKNGEDIGANILYRYQNGELTNVPLWDRSTGQFPHGALVTGLNDVPGQSLFDVHKRLNVNENGCPFPKSYAQGKGGPTALGAPQNLAVR